MNDPSGFTKLVPGFDFLQTLVKNAGAAMPGIGQWVAPTIDPEELAKRIEELRTVQFWLEQNARMLGATIQAMEVQRMTLSTLKTMNVQMDDLRDSLKITLPGMAPPASKPASAAAPARAAAHAEPAPDPARPGAIDPMQWWGALARQFTELATNAMKDPAAAAAAAAGMPGTPSKTAAADAPPADDAALKPDTPGQPSGRPPRANRLHVERRRFAVPAMKRFLHGHATHPDPQMALALAAAQIEAQRQVPGAANAPTLGWVYLTEACASHVDRLLAEMAERWPGVQWVGATGVGIAANGAEYFDEPAISLLLAEMPREQFRVFSGARPLGDFAARTANVHADPATHELAELIHDMSRRTSSGYLFGGLASSSTQAQALHIADRALSGGLSGVAFGERVGVVSRVTQGCTPVGPQREVTAAERNVITTLDGEPALDCLLRDMRLDGAEPRSALPTLRQVLVGLGGPPEGTVPLAGATAFESAVGARSRRGAFGDEVRVRHLIGLDPGRRGIAIADIAEAGMQLAFCVRNADAARRDLTRICAELREEVEPENLSLPSALALKEAANGEAAGALASHGIAGAIYVSCSGRGGAHFGAPSAELAIVRHALGDVPLAGFFAAGEIARENLYGYTGVLTVFRSAPADREQRP